MNIKINTTNLSTVWEEFLKGEVLINCIRKEDSDMFLSYCFSKNIYWGHRLEEFDQWEWFKEDTCYSVYENRLQYSDMNTKKRVIIFSPIND